MLLPFQAGAYDPGNCHSWVSSRLGEIIPMVQIVANSRANTGVVAIIDYPNVRHYAYVEGVFDNGSVLVSECNLAYLYGETKCGYRVIDDSLPGLVGYFDPTLR